MCSPKMHNLKDLFSLYYMMQSFLGSEVVQLTHIYIISLLMDGDVVSTTFI